MNIHPDKVKHCDLIYLREGVYKLVLLTPTKEALDECFLHLDNIFTHYESDQPLRLLSDIRRSGIPSLPDLWNHARLLLEKHPHPPVVYNAILHSSGTLIQVFSVVISQAAVLYGAKARLFPVTQEREVLNWLLQP